MISLCHFSQFALLRAVPAFLLVGCVLATNSNAAQPAQPAQSGQANEELAALKMQLVQLQRQLKAISASEAKPTAPFEDDERVRTVGSQRIRRAAEPMKDISLQIRLYDLSDLFAVSPSYPAEMPNELKLPGYVFPNRTGQMARGGGGGFGGGGGGGVFNVPPGNTSRSNSMQEAAALNMRSAQVSMDQLVETIQETVEPSMWGSSRESAKVQFLGNTLLITATDEMHSQIGNLLNLFREHWGKRRTISIQTYWVRATASATVELLDEKSNEVGAGVVAPDKWKAFLDSAKSEQRVVCAATLTGHNNQTLHALSGQQKQLTLDAEPFETTTARMWFENMEDVDPFGGSKDDEDDDLDYFDRTRKIIGFRPVQQSFHDGVAIQVTPMATRGGNFVILDLNAKANQLIQEEGQPRKSVFVQFGDGKAEVELDQADYVAYRLSTTLRCPHNQMVLAGSMTYDPNEQANAPNLYLFVKTMVHTINEDKSDWSRVRAGEKQGSKKRSEPGKKS